MNFKMEFTGLKEFSASLSDMARTQIPAAITKAMNRTAGGIAKAEREEMESVFAGGVTPYLKQGIKTRESGPDDRSIEVYVSDKSPGKGALSPLEILKPQVYGGIRAVKPSERRIRSWAGRSVLRADQFIVPAPGAPLDKYGNISGGKMQQLLGYIDAYAEGGYNKTKETNGHYVIPFVGVFKKRGTAKGMGTPVLFFTTSPPYYRPLFHFHTVFRNYVEKNFFRNLLDAWGAMMLKAGRYGG